MARRAVHIAGMPIRVGNEFRQRCAWCGESLIVRHLDQEAVAPGCESEAEPRYWEPNSLVEVVTSGGASASTIVAHNDGEKVPTGCCAARPVKLEVVRG